MCLTKNKSCTFAIFLMNGTKLKNTSKWCTALRVLCLPEVSLSSTVFVLW